MNLMRHTVFWLQPSLPGARGQWQGRAAEEQEGWQLLLQQSLKSQAAQGLQSTQFPPGIPALAPDSVGKGTQVPEEATLGKFLYSINKPTTVCPHHQSPAWDSPSPPLKLTWIT